MSTVQRCRQCDAALDSDPDSDTGLCDSCETSAQRAPAGVSEFASADTEPMTESDRDADEVLRRLALSNSDDTTIMDPHGENARAAEDTTIVVADDIARIRFDFLDATGAIDPLGRIGQYEVIDAVARGRFGLVLRARNPHTRQIVAVKVLAPHWAADPVTRQRFLREARLAASINHEHVVQILAIHDHPDSPYLVMEFVDGVTLQERIEKGLLAAADVIRIATQTARGLAAAHRVGVVHRDIKPANILLAAGSDQVKLTDFGLARAIGDVALSVRGTIIGTPRYMSPEQARGLDVDHRSDLFSLGSVLYSMCTGESAFGTDSTPSVLQRVCETTPAPIGVLNPDLPAELIHITERLLAKAPDERYQSADEVAERLAAIRC